MAKAIGLPHHEVETISDGKRHVRAVGQCWLGAVGNASAGVSNSGYIVLARPIAPEFLGGRLGALSEEFEQSRTMGLKMVYRPCVPATEPGGLVLTFINDPSTEFLETGDGFLERLANYQAWKDLQVFEPGELVIDPSSAILKQFSNVDTTAALSMSGMALVVSTSGWAAKNMGHLYLEYDVDFFSDYLDADVTANYTGTCLIGSTNGTPVVGNAYAPGVGAALGASASGTIVMTTTAPAGEYIAVLVCRTSAITSGALTLCNAAHPDGLGLGTNVFEEGITLFGHIVPNAASGGSFSWTSNMRCALFTSFADALSGPQDYNLPGAADLLSNALTVMSTTAPITFTSVWDVALYSLDKN
jgi:hypothetical protein